MKTNLLLIILIFSTIIVNSQTPIPGGNVYGTWTISGSPYLVQGSIMIPTDSVLTIEPGVTVNFQGHYKLLVLGQLLAIGTITNNIFFNAINTTTGWYGIRFDNTPSTNDTSKLFYCNIQWGIANGTGNDSYGGALFFNNVSKVIVKYCLIKNNSAIIGGGGIYCKNSSPIISNNTISNNSANYNAYYDGGGAIECSFGSNPMISNNIISNNSSNGYGGGIHCINCNPMIFNNTITNNTANKIGGGIYCYYCNSTISNNIISYNFANNGFNGYDGGGAIECDYSSPIISDNTISNNYGINGGGIFCLRSYSVILNNTISNNSAINGSGIYCNNSNDTLTNNTIVNNSTGGNGGALYCSDASNTTIRNCILYGNNATLNGSQVYLEDEQSDPNFYYCNIAGGILVFGLNGNFYTGIYQNNIDTNPLFVAPSSGSGVNFNGVIADWSLLNTSPCINAGNPNGTYPATDKAGNPRVVGSYIDIGAYEYQGITSVINYNLQNQIIVYPNPFNNSATIQYKNKSNYSELNIYDMYGQKIKTINDISGDHIKIERENLSSGIYFYELKQDSKEISTGKLIITD